MSVIGDNIDRIREQMARAAQRAGRRLDEIQLIAVSKKVLPEGIDEALAAGVSWFGESKVQEARAKMPVVSGRARWQLVGHLQSNKAREAVALFELIHSVDSVSLASELNKWAEQEGKTQAVLLEVNGSGEVSKFGLKPEDAAAALEKINGMSRLDVRGLMTIPPAGKDARMYFRQLRELRDRLGVTELSMGMSHDFETAIEEGATMVRIGTAIFGERK